MKFKPIYIILPILLSSPSLLAQGFQHKIDSLKRLSKSIDSVDKIKVYDEISRIFWDNSPDSSVYYAELAVKLGHVINQDALLGDAYNSLGNAYFSNNNSSEALQNYLKSKEYRERGTNTQKLAYSYNNIGIAYRGVNEYSAALNAFKEAARICQENEDFEEEAYMFLGIAETYMQINDNSKALEYAIKAANIFMHFSYKMGLANSYTLIGTLYKKLSNVNSALEYHSKANSLFEEMNNTSGISITTNNLGIIFDELNNNAKALEYYQKSLDLAVLDGNRKGEAVALNNIGYIQAKVKDYPEALTSYLHSLKISKQMNDYSSVMNTYNNIAWVHFNSGEIDKAKHYVLMALSYQHLNKNLLFKAESNEILSKIYALQKNFAKAFEHQSILTSINDSLFNKDRNETFLEMQVRFETESKEKEIELLKKTDEIKNLQIQRQKNLNILWILLSFLLVLIITLTFLNLQSKKKINILLTDKNKLLEDTNNKLKISENNLKELNDTKDRFFSIIAHDLKNPFNALLGFSELLNTNYDSYSKEEAQELIKIIHTSSNNLYKLLDNLLQWSRSQIGSIIYKPELAPLLPLFNQEIQLLKSTAEKKNIKIVSRIDDHMMVFADKNIISIVIRNLIGNAIKFSNFDSKVMLGAQEVNKMIEISITDSGVGMDDKELENLFRLDKSFTSKGTADEEGTGLGLLICKEFVEKNGGHIYATSKKGEGSTFVFSLPANRNA